MVTAADITTVIEAFQSADPRLTLDPANHTRLELRHPQSGAYISVYVTGIQAKVVATVTGPRHRTEPMPPASLPLKRRVISARANEPLSVLVNRVIKTVLPVAARQIGL